MSKATLSAVKTTTVNLNDKAWARWTALGLLAFAMFCSYIFMDILSPIKDLLQSTRGWDSTAFGTMQGSETFLNVFIFFLIFAGIILDKMGVRFTAVLSGAVMLVGATINWYALTDSFLVSGLHTWFTNHLNYIPGFDELGISPFYEGMPASAKFSAVGFMIFGCGCEMAGTTVSKSIAKWFQGKEMALAMGLEMAIARLGVFAVMWLAPMVSNMFDKSIVAPVAFCTALLVIGLLCFSVFVLMDRKLDRQMIASGELKLEKSSDEEFHVRDLGKIFSSKMFWLVALLCVLYYSAIFPFQRYAPNFLEVTLGIDAESAARLFSCFPILAMVLTPFLGALLDFRGKGATMLMVGAVIMIACHLSFAFLLPAFPSKWLALLLVVTLGVSFSLVPAALWPSVPKIIDAKILGSAYCLIFWIQNVGLCLVPLLIGKVLDATGGYTVPMIIFSSFGVLAFIFSFYLKIEDRRKNYGLEKPNII